MMIKTILVALGLTNCALSGASAQSMVWPERMPSPISDARIHQYAEDADDAYTRARAVADRALRTVESLDELDTELAVYSEIVSEGVTFTGATIDDGPTKSARLIAGTMKYPSGAIAKGKFAFLSYPKQSHWGDVVLIASPVSPFEKFVGAINHPGNAHAYPKEGVMLLRNGDRFTGLFYRGGGASGVYQRASDGMTFTGKVGFNGYSFKLENGIVEDEAKNLVAVIRD